MSGIPQEAAELVTKANEAYRTAKKLGVKAQARMQVAQELADAGNPLAVEQYVKVKETYLQMDALVCEGDKSVCEYLWLLPEYAEGSQG